MSLSGSESEASLEGESSDSSNESLHTESGDEDVIVANSVINPYENEPLADPDQELSMSVEEDEDGINPRILEARFEGNVALDNWCTCNLCRKELLVDAIEYRCCREVGPALHQLVFDASIEKISCVTLHEDYNVMTHPTVLKNVGPLLKDKDGRSYRRTGHHENEYMRAVAYRWIIRWMCGSLGWENSRPLPACIYTDIRNRFPLGKPAEHTGYISAQKRN